MKKKVLFIMHFFPPNGEVQSKINLSTVNAFKQCGWEPIIITCKSKNFEQQEFNEIIKNFIIIYYEEAAFDRFLDKIRNKLKVPREINIYNGVYRNIVQSSKKLLDKMKVDLIYSVSAVGDCHRAGLFLSKKYNVPWAAEFQDPWLHNITMNKWLNDNSFSVYKKMLIKKISKLLKKILVQAILIIVETQGHKKKLSEIAQSINVSEKKIKVAYLGIDRNLLGNLGSPIIKKFFDFENMKTIGFVGKIYYGYGERVDRFIECLKRVEQKKLNFLFITVGCDQFPNLLRKAGIKNYLSIYKVTYREALGLMDKIDLGLVIPSSKININSKIFDYMERGCSVLVWGRPDWEMAKFVTKYNCGVLLDDRDMDFAVQQLIKILEKTERNEKVREVGFKYSRHEQLKTIIDKIDNIIINKIN